jgi:hypothetical protein
LIPITNTDANPIAWYIENRWLNREIWWMVVKFLQVMSTNFNNIFFNHMVTVHIPNV